MTSKKNLTPAEKHENKLENIIRGKTQFQHKNRTLSNKRGIFDSKTEAIKDMVEVGIFPNELEAAKYFNEKTNIDPEVQKFIENRGFAPPIKVGTHSRFGFEEDKIEEDKYSFNSSQIKKIKFKSDKELVEFTLKNSNLAKRFISNLEEIFQEENYEQDLESWKLKFSPYVISNKERKFYFDNPKLQPIIEYDIFDSVNPLLVSNLSPKERVKTSFFYAMGILPNDESRDIYAMTFNPNNLSNNLESYLKLGEEEKEELEIKVKKILSQNQIPEVEFTNLAYEFIDKKTLNFMEIDGGEPLEIKNYKLPRDKELPAYVEKRITGQKNIEIININIENFPGTQSWINKHEDYLIEEGFTIINRNLLYRSKQLKDEFDVSLDKVHPSIIPIFYYQDKIKALVRPYNPPEEEYR